MLLLALKEAARYGWQLAASADVSAKYVHQENGPDYPADVHSWFFCYQGDNPSSATLSQGQILLDQHYQSLLRLLNLNILCSVGMCNTSCFVTIQPDLSTMQATRQSLTQQNKVQRSDTCAI